MFVGIRLAGHRARSFPPARRASDGSTRLPAALCADCRQGATPRKSGSKQRPNRSAFIVSTGGVHPADCTGSSLRRSHSSGGRQGMTTVLRTACKSGSRLSCRIGPGMPFSTWARRSSQTPRRMGEETSATLPASALSSDRRVGRVRGHLVLETEVIRPVSDQLESRAAANLGNRQVAAVTSTQFLAASSEAVLGTVHTAARPRWLPRPAPSTRYDHVRDLVCRRETMVPRHFYQSGAGSKVNANRLPHAVDWTALVWPASTQWTGFHWHPNEGSGRRTNRLWGHRWTDPIGKGATSRGRIR